MDCTEDSFRVRLTNESHTLKRALADPRMMSGIGNAYSDEILHAARLSSFRLASKLNLHGIDLRGGKEQVSHYVFLSRQPLRPILVPQHVLILPGEFLPDGAIVGRAAVYAQHTSPERWEIEQNSNTWSSIGPCSSLL